MLGVLRVGVGVEREQTHPCSSFTRQPPPSRGIMTAIRNSSMCCCPGRPGGPHRAAPPLPVSTGTEGHLGEQPPACSGAQTL